MTSPYEKLHKAEACVSSHIDTDKLKRLAEAWKKWGEHPYANAILALIAENERLRALVSLGNKAILREGLEADRYQRQRDDAFLARIDVETQEK